jgi:hypothetical protein
MNGPLVWPTQKGTFHSAVLISEGNLQVEHFLPMALKTEMARLDHSGVDGSDGDLVNLLALDAIEVGNPDVGCFRRRAVPGVVIRPPRGVIADGLEPGVAFETESKLFGDLPFEEVDLRASGSQGRDGVDIDVASQNSQARPEVVREDRPEIDGAFGRHSKEGGDPQA